MTPEQKVEMLKKSRLAGFEFKFATHMLREGFVFEGGVWLRGDVLPTLHLPYMVTIYFHNADGKLVSTLARAESKRKALKRAYRYRYWIMEHGSLMGGFKKALAHVVESDEPEELAAIA